MIGLGLWRRRRIQQAILLHLPDSNVEISWSYLMWLLARTITDLREGQAPPEAEAMMTQAIMRVMAVDPEHAAKVARAELPVSLDLDVDFSFSLDPFSQDAEQAWADAPDVRPEDPGLLPRAPAQRRRSLTGQLARVPTSLLAR
jgi:hypothetical protein